MIGMVIVTHGNIGVELLKVLNTKVGQQAQARAISVGGNDDMETCRSAIATAISEVSSGDGVVLITDLGGATPSNLAVSVMPPSQAVLLAGANLPMLVRFAAVRDTMPLLDAAQEAMAAGKKNIVQASVILPTLPPPEGPVRPADKRSLHMGGALSPVAKGQVAAPM